MGIAPAPLALFVLCAAFLLSGIVLCAVAPSIARGEAEESLTLLQATRSRYLMDQVATPCGFESNGCDGSCDPISIASSIPTIASFKFYNITNPDSVTGDVPPQLEEVGPYTCLSAPPIMTARFSWTTTPASSADDTVAFQPSLECTLVADGDAIVYLYDKSDGIKAKTASGWIHELKASILSGDGTVGAGGAPAFASYAAHGNSSMPNSYMRRSIDDAPVVPLFPHASLSDGDVRLKPVITSDTVLQWYIASVGQTVSFSWKHGLYVIEPVWDAYLYARFIGIIPESDLTSRGSQLYDKVYSYHNCRTTTALDGTGYPSCADAVSTTVYGWPEKDDVGPMSFNFIANFEAVSTVPATSDALSPDDFFIDIDLMFGVPSAIKDVSGAGAFQAHSYPEFAAIATSDPNCTGAFADSNVSPLLWTFGFWSGGTLPWVSHTEAGYDPIIPGDQGKWLAEFGVSRNGATLPAFAFSMMPKMWAFLAPDGLGKNFPATMMGASADCRSWAGKSMGIDFIPTVSSYMWLFGQGAPYYYIYYSHAMYTFYLYLGIYTIVWAFVPLLVTAIVRLKIDAKN